MQTVRRPTRLLALAAAGLLAGLSRAPASAAPAQGLPLPAAHCGPYPNLFAGLLGKSDAEVDARIAAWWQQLFYGDDSSQRIYYPTADGMAHISDIRNADVRTEGLSYGMMIAVQLDHRPEFDRMWAFARRHLYHESGPFKGYFAWHSSFDGHPLSQGPATDGEEWFAMALLFASHRWGNREGIFDYETQAQAILRTMLHKHEDPERGEVTDMFDRDTHLAVFVPEGPGATYSDPSYLLPAFYELWARWADDPADRQFYAAAAQASRASWQRTAHPRTGLMPDYANFDGTPKIRKEHQNFQYDAWRTLAYPALDWSWWRADPWEPEEANRVLRFLGGAGAGAGKFKLDGTALPSEDSPGLYAMAAVAGLAAEPDVARPFVRHLWEMPIPEGRWRYYDANLGLLALLEAGGRFRIYGPR